ncbi:reverse transcriptase domain-containing protein [Tanacetum coccineum]
MFCQTLSGSARNWFDSLDPKSVDGFEELSSKFLEEFSHQKRYDKDPTKIHDIKRKPNEELQAFMDCFKAESAHIKGVPLAFIRGEAAVDTTEAIRSPRRLHTSDENSEKILAMDNVNFPPPPLMIKEAVASGRLAHLVKDIRQGGQKGKGSTKGKEKGYQHGEILRVPEEALREGGALDG